MHRIPQESLTRRHCLWFQHRPASSRHFPAGWWGRVRSARLINSASSTALIIMQLSLFSLLHQAWAHLNNDILEMRNSLKISRCRWINATNLSLYIAVCIQGHVWLKHGGVWTSPPYKWRSEKKEKEMETSILGIHGIAGKCIHFSLLSSSTNFWFIKRMPWQEENRDRRDSFCSFE